MSLQPVKLPKGWFLRDVAKAAKRAAQWAAPPPRGNATTDEEIENA